MATVLISVVLLAFILLALRDVLLQDRHAIQHNFPIVGHLRYLLELIGPELRQYWVANDKEELPFSRSERSWVYASAKGQNNTTGFGTSDNMFTAGYPIIKHSAFPRSDHDVPHFDDPTLIPCLKVIGKAHKRRRPYRPMSVINISAMSYGSLGRNAVQAINTGAKAAKAYHNTGEGGVSPHHQMGADVCWQLGTGYYGARADDGSLDFEKLVAQVEAVPRIRMIELKLSQGAKAGKGGILPGAKVTEEIAGIRGIPQGVDCHSPNGHSAFKDVDGLIDLIEKIANLTGLPVGIKSAVGKLEFWSELASRMSQRGEGPDWIQIDGGEGGTGAAPLTFADHVSLPFREGFARVYPLFVDEGVAADVVWIGSGKLGFPDRAVVAFAMGCDMINVAREAMMAVGCIQAQKCHTGKCPAGVATHNAWLQAGLDVDDKAYRLQRYLQTFRQELLSLTHAAGYEHPGQFTSDDVEYCHGAEHRFVTLAAVLGYQKNPVPYTDFTDYTPV